jgi:hypothetical protein
MFLACGEFSEACKEYVIAFLPVSDAQGNPTQDVTPVAVLGLRQDENLYVEANGRWDARYLPAYMRRYPLSYARTAEEQNSVMVDADWEGFNDTEGELLIEENGEPAPYLQQMMHFLDVYDADAQRTRLVCERLVALDLMRPVNIDMTMADGSKLSASGLQVIDEQKLKALPDEQALELVRNGVMGLVHAHLISTTNLPRLTERMALRADAEAKGAVPAK